MTFEEAAALCPEISNVRYLCAYGALGRKPEPGEWQLWNRDKIREFLKIYIPNQDPNWTYDLRSLIHRFDGTMQGVHVAYDTWLKTQIG